MYRKRGTRYMYTVGLLHCTAETSTAMESNYTPTTTTMTNKFSGNQNCFCHRAYQVGNFLKDLLISEIEQADGCYNCLNFDRPVHGREAGLSIDGSYRVYHQSQETKPGTKPLSAFNPLHFSFRYMK